jgi:hypothetical protein
MEAMMEAMMEREKNKGKKLLTDLPDELIHEIFKYMTWRQIVLCFQVNKSIKMSLGQLDMFGKGEINRNIHDTSFLYDAQIVSTWFSWTNGKYERKIGRPWKILRHSKHPNDISIVQSTKFWNELRPPVLRMYRFLKCIPMTGVVCALRDHLCMHCKDGIMRKFSRQCPMKACTFCCTEELYHSHLETKPCHFCNVAPVKYDTA